LEKRKARAATKCVGRGGTRKKIGGGNGWGRVEKAKKGLARKTSGCEGGQNSEGRNLCEGAAKNVKWKGVPKSGKFKRRDGDKCAKSTGCEYPPNGGGRGVAECGGRPVNEKEGRKGK